MLFDPSDFAFVNGGVGSAGLSLVANTKSANGLFDPRFAPTQLATASSRLESAIRYLLTEKYASAPAAWYDPSDMSTLFQDAAGTTPVTAVEQPVGLMLDKSGRGNHATQATTTTKRPVYSRRVNLLLATTTLSTQSITTRSAAYTLSFSGAGSITLSGSATGAYSAGTHAITCTAGSLTLTVTGVVADAWCVLTTDAHLPYQRVNTATDYDADPAKFPAYLRFDGVDDALQTGNIDFTSTDKMTVWAGVTKLSDTPFGNVASCGLLDSGGGFYLVAPTSGATYGARSRGTVLSALTEVGGYPAPHSAVLCGVFDVAGRKADLRVGGVTTTNGTDQGVGNFSLRPLAIGANPAGIDNFFNGRLYSLIVCGAQTPLSEIEVTERYIKQKMRMP